MNFDIKLRPAYKTTKIGSYFSLKSTIPDLFKANVVYEFKCPRDEDPHQTYIGETQRQLFKRIADHHPSAANKEKSAVCDHIMVCPYCQDNSIIDCFKIIKRSSSHNVLSEEALCIKKLNPSLNIQMGTFKGARVPTNIFN